jgi:hypothetical protein
MIVRDDTPGPIILEREYPLPTEGERSILDPIFLKRFMAKIEATIVEPEVGECWIWQGAVNGHGYGRFSLGLREGKRFIAYTHRVSYMHFVGPVPEGWVVDHMCNHKMCVRPSHLETIPGMENIKRAWERRPWKRRNQYSKE